MKNDLPRFGYQNSWFIVGETLWGKVIKILLYNMEGEAMLLDEWALRVCSPAPHFQCALCASA